MPAGEALYESLSTKFVVLDRILAALSEAAYSGYIRVVSEAQSGLLLLRNGRVTDALSRNSDDGVVTGSEALTSIGEVVGRGEGVVDIVGLSPEVVDSLHHLASGAPRYPDLHASWVNIDGLIGFLGERRFTGNVSVSTRSGGGVVMLSRGEVSAAFTTNSPRVASTAADVVALCQDPGARIEVREATEPLDGEVG